jgi:RNA polymerase sigma factor (sigma-70 family)
MPTRLPTLARHTAALAIRISDGEYLRRFVESRDEDAFAELVRRNGPLVLRACRSLLRDPAAADDAFQVTFLQLARHASALTTSPCLAGWLHKAAVRAAGAVRRSDARRRRRELRAQPTPATQPPADPTWSEVREAIDAELARLPEKYRLPLLLCYLEGLTYSDAAARLGCPLGALRGRLERGRQALRRRLEARGLPAVALTLGAGVPPAVSAELHKRTLAVCTLLGRRAGLMNWSALAAPRRVFLAGSAAVLVALGIGLGAVPSSTDPPKDPTPAAPTAPGDGNARAPDSPRDVFGDPLPRGAVARLGTERFQEYGHDFTLSPDGKMIAVSDSGESLALLDAVTGEVLRRQASICVRGDSSFLDKERRITVPGIFWRPDGRGVALVERYPWDMYLWDFTDPKDTPPRFELPEGFQNPGNNPPAEPPEGGVSCAAVSADGKWIAVVRQPSDPDRRVIQVFPCKTGTYLRDLKAERTLGPFPAACERIWFTADGRELVLARTDHTVVAIDAVGGKELRRATLPKWFAIALSPDGKFVALVPQHPEEDSAGEESVRVWDLCQEGVAGEGPRGGFPLPSRGREVWKFPRPGWRYGLAFTPDGKHLITSDRDFYVRKWDLASGKEDALRRVPKGNDYSPRTSLSISADGKRYATAQLTPIKVWDAGTGKHLNPLATHLDAVYGVAVSPDSRLVATVERDGTLRVWQAAGGKPVCTGPDLRTDPWGMNFSSYSPAVAFTPDGRGVLFDAPGTLALADPKTGKLLKRPDGLKNLTGTLGGSTADGKTLTRPGGVKYLARTLGGFTADGKTLITFSGDTTTLWDWPAGTARQKFRVSLGARPLGAPPSKPQRRAVTVNAVLSPDGGMLLVTSEQHVFADEEPGFPMIYPNSIDCWDVKTGKHRYGFATDLWHAHLAFSPDGRTLYVGGPPSDPECLHGRLRREALTARDVATGMVLQRFEDPLYRPDAPPTEGRHILALALSPDGRLLAISEGSSHTVWIYETVSGRIVRRFEGHTSEIQGLAFTPDGSRVVSASHDHTGLVWDITLPTFTDRKGGTLTPRELADAWDRLAAPDPVRAWRAVADLTGSPAEAVGLLADRLKSPSVPTAADLDRIEKQLGAPDFEDREKASADLDAYGPGAATSVKERLKATESPEVSNRFTEFLKRHTGERPSPLVLRGVRGVAVLEAIGSPDARKVLARLAGGPGDPLAVEAAAALARLERPGARK